MTETGREPTYVEVDAWDEEHDPTRCFYCTDNAYDETPCRGCNGTGGTKEAPCESCDGHGFSGYSW